jgi:hypothetical protein
MSAERGARWWPDRGRRHFAAGLLLWVYIGRLVILDPKSAGVLPFAVVLGFAVNPALYAWLGLTLLRERS